MTPKYIQQIVRAALKEDIGEGDITTNSLIPKDLKSQARLIAKDNGIICGMAIAEQVFKTLNPSIRFKALVHDGQKVAKSQVLAEIKGASRALLTGERVAINFLSYLSGIASETRFYVDAIKPYKAKIMDTRKTTPLLRPLERYAVSCGGGVNHRFNLNDMAMIKDNHRVACLGQQSLIEAVEKIRKQTHKKIELEVDTLTQLDEALQSKADIILLDNMTPSQVGQAVKRRDSMKRKVLLEASGGINLKNVRSYAASGVDRISIGALTHSPGALNISLDFI